MKDAPPIADNRNILAAAKTWKDLSHDYEKQVFSVTSFPARRKRILQEVAAGVVVDLGCGPLGLILRDIAALPGTRAVGSAFCFEMISESRRHTSGLNIEYLVADNRSLPFADSSVDT